MIEEQRIADTAGRLRDAYRGLPILPLRDVLEPTDAIGDYADLNLSFLRHAEKASANHGIDAREILVELARRRMVGGREDMIVDVALDLVLDRERAA